MGLLNSKRVERLGLQKRTLQDFQYVARMERKFVHGVQITAPFWDLFYRVDESNDMTFDDPRTASMASHSMACALIAVERNEPEWFVMLCLIQHFGKCFNFLGGSGKDGTSKRCQWGLMGDSFVLGHPAASHQYRESIYEVGCGLSTVTMSFGHSELLYQVLRRMCNYGRCHLPEEALFVLRFRCLVSWHSESEYADLEDALDIKYKPSIQRFYEIQQNACRDVQDVVAHQPDFEDLVQKFFPARTIEF